MSCKWLDRYWYSRTCFNSMLRSAYLATFHDHEFPETIRRKRHE